MGAAPAGARNLWTKYCWPLPVTFGVLVMRMLREERFRLEDEGGETRVEW